MAMSKSVELDERARFHARNVVSSRMLLEALRLNHDTIPDEEPELKPEMETRVYDSIT